MNQKESKVLRTEVVKQASELINIEGYRFEGFSSEGAVFMDGEGESFVVRVIVKKPETDVLDQIAKFEAKVAKEAKEAKEKEEKGE